MDLFIDIGNTNIKVQWKKQIIRLNTNKKYAKNFWINDLPSSLHNIKPEKIWICAVVKQKMLVFIEEMIRYFKIQPQIINHKLVQPLLSSKINLAKLGSDLLAIANFINDQTTNGILVNLGTATTITHVKNKIIQGIIIIPGFKISLDSLFATASAIKNMPLSLPQKQKMGYNTQQSISIGVIQGTIHMINNFVHDIDQQAKLFLSGGNAFYIEKYLPNFAYFEEATLLGMKIIAQKN